MTKQTIALEIVEFSTQEVVRTFPVAGKSEREIELIMRGMLRNMDTDNFCIREVQS